MRQLIQLTATQGACREALPEDIDLFIKENPSPPEVGIAMQYCNRCPVKQECIEVVLAPTDVDDTMRSYFSGIAGGKVFVNGQDRAAEVGQASSAAASVILRGLHGDGWPMSLLATRTGIRVDTLHHWVKRGGTPRLHRITEEHYAALNKAWHTLPPEPENQQGRFGVASRRAKQTAEKNGWIPRQQLGLDAPLHEPSFVGSILTDGGHTA